MLDHKAEIAGCETIDNMSSRDNVSMTTSHVSWVLDQMKSGAGCWVLDAGHWMLGARSDEVGC